MAVQLTEKAAQRVQSMLVKRGPGVGLRLGTRKSGCSGFAYVVDFVRTNALNAGFSSATPTTRSVVVAANPSASE